MLTNLEGKVREGDYGCYTRNDIADTTKFLNIHVCRLPATYKERPI
jgi:hypothetical protein